MLFTLTLNRVLNYILLNFSYLLSRLTGSVVLWGKPYALSVESSGSCQLKCPECPLGSGQNAARKYMSQELYTRIISECKPHCMVLSMYFQGEAFLNPNIFSFISKAKKARIYSILSTNANFSSSDWAEKVVKSGLNELIISLDGMSENTYQMYRKGGSLKLVMNNLEQLSEALKKNKKPGMKVKIQFLIMKHNEHEIPEVKALAKKLKFRLSLKSVQIQNPQSDVHLLPGNRKYRRYKKTDNGFVLMNPLKNHCKRIFYNPVITSEGEVRPCCFDKAGEFPMGNINRDSFDKIWRSENYRSFRKRIFSERKNTDICRNCTEGTKNVYV